MKSATLSIFLFFTVSVFSQESFYFSSSSNEIYLVGTKSLSSYQTIFSIKSYKQKVDSVSISLRNNNRKQSQFEPVAVHGSAKIDKSKKFLVAKTVEFENLDSTIVNYEARFYFYKKNGKLLDSTTTLFTRCEAILDISKASENDTILIVKRNLPLVFIHISNDHDCLQNSTELNITIDNQSLLSTTIPPNKAFSLPLSKLRYGIYTANSGAHKIIFRLIENGS